jgi:hypothetical protein
MQPAVFAAEQPTSTSMRMHSQSQSHSAEDARLTHPVYELCTSEEQRPNGTRDAPVTAAFSARGRVVTRKLIWESEPTRPTGGNKLASQHCRRKNGEKSIVIFIKKRKQGGDTVE